MEWKGIIEFHRGSCTVEVRSEFLPLLVSWVALLGATQDADPNQGLHIQPNSSEKKKTKTFKVKRWPFYNINWILSPFKIDSCQGWMDHYLLWHRNLKSLHVRSCKTTLPVALKHQTNNMYISFSFTLKVPVSPYLLWQEASIPTHTSRISSMWAHFMC